GCRERQERGEEALHVIAAEAVLQDRRAERRAVRHERVHGRPRVDQRAAAPTGGRRRGDAEPEGRDEARAARVDARVVEEADRVRAAAFLREAEALLRVEEAAEAALGRRHAL